MTDPQAAAIRQVIAEMRREARTVRAASTPKINWEHRARGYEAWADELEAALGEAPASVTVPEPQDPPEDLECDPTTRWHEGWKAGYLWACRDGSVAYLRLLIDACEDERHDGRQMHCAICRALATIREGEAPAAPPTQEA